LSSPPPGERFSNSEKKTKRMMSIDLNDPVAVLIAASQALERAKIEAAAYGGLALAVYGQPRETKDADLAVAGVRAVDAESALRTAGCNVLIAFEAMRFGGQFVSRLTLFGGDGGSLNTVDLIEPRSERYSREVLRRAVTGELRARKIRIVSPEDFVVLKILATRERDLEDAASVISSLSGGLDLKLIEDEVSLLAIEIPDHDIANRWKRIQ
jgi:nucleotidyltransferase DUF2204